MPGTTPTANSPGRTALKVASATPTGLILLGIIFMYVALASIMPPPAGRPVGTPSVLYGWWPLKLLTALAVVNLILATVLRIRLSWVNLGAWAAHAGVVLLAIGSVWYMTAGVRGFAVASRPRAGAAFSTMDRFFVNDTLAMYIGDTPALASAMQTPVGELLAAEGKTGTVRLAVRSPLADVGVTARSYLRRAEMAYEFRDDGPADLPAARIVIEDGPHAFRRVLCPAYPLNREFDVSPYVVRFAPAGAKQPPEWMLRRRSKQQDVVVLGRTAEGRVSALVLAGDGTRTEMTSDIGGKMTLTLGGREVALTVTKLYSRAWRRWTAFASKERSHPGAVELEVRVGEWTARQWVRFDGYVAAGESGDVPVQRLPLPGGRTAFLRFAPESRPLPTPLRISHWEHVTYPGSAKTRDYVCRLVPAGAAEAGQIECRLNNPAAIGGLRMYQGSWSPSPEDPREIRFMVSLRPGMWLVWTGASLICLFGVPYAFYVKPMLLRRKGGSGA